MISADVEALTTHHPTELGVKLKGVGPTRAVLRGKDLALPIHDQANHLIPLGVELKNVANLDPDFISPVLVEKTEKAVCFI